MNVLWVMLVLMTAPSQRCTCLVGKPCKVESELKLVKVQSSPSFISLDSLLLSPALSKTFKKKLFPINKHSCNYH